MKRILRHLTLPAIAMAAALPAMAASPVAPNVPTGSFHCFRGMPSSEINYMEAPDSHMMRIGTKLGNSKWDNTDGHDIREVITEGKLRVLVIIVNFQDNKFSQGKDNPRGLVEEMLNGDNFTYQNATGSANAFYQAVSGDQFDPQFDVYGPVQLSKKSVEYVSPTCGNPEHPDWAENPEDNPDCYFIDPATGKQVQKYPASRMVAEAVKALDDQVNFADYDSNKDGVVDFVYIFYAGKGATTGGNRLTTIWPHAFTLTAGLGEPIEMDGVTIDRYACSSELGRDNKLSGVGTFCHEFGHVLGLPDIYDTAHNGSTAANFTAGTFTCMDAGNYNNNEHTPPYFSSYEQYGLEWLLPRTIDGGGRLTLLPMGARKFAYKFNTSNPQEYFLIEARDKHSYDYFLECHGLAVWHIDFDLDIWQKNCPNNNDAHQRIDLIEADNDRQTTSRDGDLFPGVNGICSFTENVSPAFVDWNNKSTGYRLREISRNFDGTVSFLCQTEADVEMEGANIAAPVVEIVEAKPNAITVRFATVEGAKDYYLSAFPAAKFDGTFINDYVEGFYYAPAVAEDGYVTLTITGLTEGETYGILAYAANDTNASRTVAPLYVSTMADTFEQGVADTFVMATADETPATILSWTPVNGATSYDVTVARRSADLPAEAIEPALIPFDNTTMPSDWDGNGNFDQRAKYSGESMPSYQLAHSGAYLVSGTYEHQIKEISFWARNRFDENLYHLDIYGIDNKGNLIPAAVITDLTPQGGRYNVAFPAGCYGVKFVYFLSSTGLDCNIDDINIEFTDSFTDLPVADLDITPIHDTAVVVRGLDADTEYVAYVTPLRNEEKGCRSKEVIFRPAALNVSGVDEITGDDFAEAGYYVADGRIVAPDNAPFSVYAADGTCLARDAKGSFSLPRHGLFIVAGNGKTTKICW